MRRVLCVCAAVILLAAAGPLGAADLAGLVGAENAAALLRNEILTRIQSKSPSPVLIPRKAEVTALAESMIKSLSPSFFVEALTLYRKPDSAAVVNWSAAERAAVYNNVLALSTLAGIQYYSTTRKEWRTFYETSSVVSGSDGKRTIPDPVYAVPPEELTIFARQKDLSFGDNVYRYDYYVHLDSLIFVQENLTSMNYGLIPAVGKNKLRSMVAVIDCGDYLLVYAASMAKAASLPGVADKVGRSFTTRIEAVLGWFTGQADRAFAFKSN